jgi:hypothetical protein
MTGLTRRSTASEYLVGHPHLTDAPADDDGADFLCIRMTSFLSYLTNRDKRGCAHSLFIIVPSGITPDLKIVQGSIRLPSRK